MKFTTAAYTDVGIRKKTNQDSLLIIESETDYGHILMSIVCDGMGGLSKGELASAVIIKVFKNWFEKELPTLIVTPLEAEAVFDGWNKLVQNISHKISLYGNSQGAKLGSTLVVILFYENQYFVMNVGDSRAYKISNGIFQITKDQTYIQREMDLGRLTPEQARVDPQRNVLLQCIGASDVVIPDTYVGMVNPGDVFLICSDGFRHVITPDEIYQSLNKDTALNEIMMHEALVRLTELNKYRREDDNISAAAIRAD